jgi:hypothetical protein
MRMLETALFSLCLVLGVACGSEPGQSLDLRGDWIVDVSTTTSTSTCTIVGANLTLSGTPTFGGGSLAGGEVSCTGDGAWPLAYDVGGSLDGTAVTLSLAIPGTGEPDLLLEGEAAEDSMGGGVHSVPGTQRVVTGTWSAHR